MWQIEFWNFDRNINHLILIFLSEYFFLYSYKNRKDCFGDKVSFCTKSNLKSVRQMEMYIYSSRLVFLYPRGKFRNSSHLFSKTKYLMFTHKIPNYFLSSWHFCLYSNQTHNLLSVITLSRPWALENFLNSKKTFMSFSLIFISREFK
jgi:hypothetical protein